MLPLAPVTVAAWNDGRFRATFTLRRASTDTAHHIIAFTKVSETNDRYVIIVIVVLFAQPQGPPHCSNTTPCIIRSGVFSGGIMPCPPRRMKKITDRFSWYLWRRFLRFLAPKPDSNSILGSVMLVLSPPTLWRLLVYLLTAGEWRW